MRLPANHESYHEHMENNTIKTITAYDNSPYFTVEKEQGSPMQRVRQCSTVGVVVIPMLENGLVVCGMHPRFALDWKESLELPRGSATDTDNDTIDTAIRELHEETGISAERDDARDLGIIHADTGLVKDNTHVILIHLPAGTGITGRTHDDEFSMLETCTPRDIIERTSDSLTISALAKMVCIRRHEGTDAENMGRAIIDMIDRYSEMVHAHSSNGMTADLLNTGRRFQRQLMEHEEED
jgi:8-oxo-dGTP pyrophosphatase MutT (NUDIX family)